MLISGLEKTVTASDPGGLSATQTMGVTVEAANEPPAVVAALDDRTLTVGDSLTADVADAFEDPEGDSLAFGASSSDTTVATASVAGSTLTVLAVAAAPPPSRSRRPPPRATPPRFGSA